MGVSYNAIPLRSLPHASLTGVTAVNHHTATVETVHPDPSVDEVIARYNGIAGALQGYTSQAPTLSDAGVLTLPSGEINFPDAQVSSADVNSLDDYEEGVWTPNLQDNTRSDAESQTADIAIGTYTKIGNRVFFQFRLVISSLGSLTTSEVGFISGLPFTSITRANAAAGIAAGQSGGLAVTAGSNPGGTISSNTAGIALNLFDAVTGSTGMLISEITADGSFQMSGHYDVAT